MRRLELVNLTMVTRFKGAELHLRVKRKNKWVRKKKKIKGLIEWSFRMGSTSARMVTALRMQRITVSQELTLSLNEGEWPGGQKMMVTRRKAPESQGN